jgi:hypothetical protein
MNTQTLPELELFDPIPKIKGLGSRKVALSSLRPGDWLELLGDGDTYQYLVLINSSKKRILVVRGWDDQEDRWSYDALDSHVRRLGQGKPRVWWSYLPFWFKQRINPYSYPAN